MLRKPLVVGHGQQGLAGVSCALRSGVDAHSPHPPAMRTAPPPVLHVRLERDPLQPGPGSPLHPVARTWKATQSGTDCNHAQTDRARQCLAASGLAVDTGARKIKPLETDPCIRHLRVHLHQDSPSTTWILKGGGTLRNSASSLSESAPPSTYLPGSLRGIKACLPASALPHPDSMLTSIAKCPMCLSRHTASFEASPEPKYEKMWKSMSAQSWRVRADTLDKTDR